MDRFQFLDSNVPYVLQTKLDNPLPEISPRLSNIECTIFDEDTFDHLLSRSIVPSVSVGLRAGWGIYHSNQLDRGIDITRGGRARRVAAHDNQPSDTPSGIEKS